VSTAGDYRLLEGLASETKSGVPLIKSFQSLAFIFRSQKTNRTINMITVPETFPLTRFPNSTFLLSSLLSSIRCVCLCDLRSQAV